MRILFISPLGLKQNADYKSQKQFGAVEQQVWGLCKELTKMGHQTFIARNWKCEKELEEYERINLVNVPVPDIASQKKIESRLSIYRLAIKFSKYLIYIKKLEKRLDKISPDIINISSLLPAYFLSISNIPKIFITHNLDIYSIEERIFKPFVMSMLRKISKADTIVTLNRSQKEYLVSNGISVQAVIPNGIDVEEIIQNDNKIRKNTITYAGRLVPHKNVDELIEIFSELQEDISQDLTIIGSGPLDVKLKKYVVEKKLENRLTFYPILPRKEYYCRLSESTFFVLPSRAEGFGVALIEAMALGKPVLARNIIGPGDIITHYYNGFLFNNTNELKEYIKLLSSDPNLRRKLGTNARRTVEEKYTFDKIAKQYLRLYEKLVD